MMRKCLFVINIFVAFNSFVFAQKQIYVSDFGAIPDDELDDSDAIRKATLFCRDNPSTTLFFSPGVYVFRDQEALRIEKEAINGTYGEDVQGHLFKPDAPYVKAIDLAGCENVMIDAEGATLVMEGWYEVVSIEQAKNIKIKGLSIVYRRPPNTVGIISQLTDEGFKMFFDSKRYCYFDSIVTGRIHYFDNEKKRLFAERGSDKKLISSDTISIRTDYKHKIGDYCVLRHSGHYRAAVFIKESKNVSLQNVKIHSQPGMGVVGHLTENITMDNLQVVPEPGDVISTNTDATHFTSCTGTIVIEDSKFAGQGDDCTNIHNYYYSIYPRSKNKVEIRVENADLHALSLDYPSVGDTMLVVDKSNLSELDCFVVQKVDTSIRKWEVCITLNKSLDIELIDNYYMTNITRRPFVRIMNNTVKSHLARAFLIKSSNVLISNNAIQSSTGTAIQLGAEIGWRESSPVENVLVENNWIVGCGYGVGIQGGASGISVGISGESKRVPFVNKNIVIRNNIIEAVNKYAISIEDAQNVKVYNNKISGCSQNVYIDNADAVEIK